jgi:UDP-glucose 4-epimerase
MIIQPRTSQHLDNSTTLSNCIGRDGTCVRDYLHIMDLASGHLLALEALGPDSKIFKEGVDASFRAYNLGRGQGVSVLQIVEAMRKATRFDYKYEIIGRRCVSLYHHRRP